MVKKFKLIHFKNINMKIFEWFLLYRYQKTLIFKGGKGKTSLLKTILNGHSFYV